MNRTSALYLLRQKMVAEKLDAYILPSSDPHQSEYIPDHWQFRAWFSGFTGSAGTIVVTRDFAGLWTDSRYFIQAAKQLEGSGIELVKLKTPHTPEFIDWLGKTLSPGKRVGFDSRFFTVAMVRLMQQSFKDKGIKLVAGPDLLTPLWKNRPALPDHPVISYDIRYAGLSRVDKINLVKERLRGKGGEYHLITTLDDIAWLLNLRGNDVDFCPFFVSYALIGPEKTWLFIDPSKVPDTLKKQLAAEGIVLKPYDQISSFLEALPTDSNLYFDPGRTSQTLYDAIPEKMKRIEGINLTTLLKSIKNPVEIRQLKEVMIRDGVAWVKLLYWLDQELKQHHKLTELSIAQQIAIFRSEQKDYRGESFHPISSYNWHGAVIHYSVNAEESLTVHPDGIFLLDSGGHYLGGTTDTTRTISLSKPTAEQKAHFTRVLKGTLGISMLKFPRGTKGFQMDVLARQSLWKSGLNYGHGTGHGVGSYLSVHEGPQTIGTSASGNQNIIFEPGMVTTVEPGIYLEGAYGIRTENMTLVVEDEENEFGRFYRFETLTLVPIDQNLIDTFLLTRDEIDWLNRYHKRVFQTLAPLLTPDEQLWLKQKTQPLT
ncbi:MAG: aminopeptidase P family protein [Bacteroidales bacterium]|nr:aminopeptidase P family protein [Bacteroidales bacterium]